MSLYHPAEPAAINQYRDNTGRSAGLLNVNIVPARELCVDCRRYRTKATGTMKKRGFVCGMCGGRK